MANSIAYVKNYTDIIDRVYQRASVSSCLNSGRRMVRAGRNAREVMIPKIEVSGLGDYVRNEGYKTGSINYEFETKTFNYDRGIRLMADVMDVEEAGVLDCFVEAGSELQRTQVAPEADAFTFAMIAQRARTKGYEDLSEAEAGDVLAGLRAATSQMDEAQVTAGSRYLFITPTLKGVLDDFSSANPARSNRVLERFAKIVEVPQSRFYTAIDLLGGGDGQFGYRIGGAAYAKATGAFDEEEQYYTKDGDYYEPVEMPDADDFATYYVRTQAAGSNINYMIVEKSAVIKFDKHVASRVFSPDELENLDSYMMKYRKYGIVEVLDNKRDGVYVSCKRDW